MLHAARRSEVAESGQERHPLVLAARAGAGRHDARQRLRATEKGALDSQARSQFPATRFLHPVRQQRVKKFHVRAEFKDGEVRGMTLQRESLVGEQKRIINRMKATLIRLGIRGFNPKLRRPPIPLRVCARPRASREIAHRFRRACLTPRVSRGLSASGQQAVVSIH